MDCINAPKPESMRGQENQDQGADLTVGLLAVRGCANKSTKFK